MAKSKTPPSDTETPTPSPARKAREVKPFVVEMIKQEGGVTAPMTPEEFPTESAAMKFLHDDASPGEYRIIQVRKALVRVKLQTVEKRELEVS